MKGTALSRVTEASKLDRLSSGGSISARSSMTGINPLDAAMEPFKVCVEHHYLGVVIFGCEKIEKEIKNVCFMGSELEIDHYLYVRVGRSIYNDRRLH